MEHADEYLVRRLSCFEVVRPSQKYSTPERCAVFLFVLWRRGGNPPSFWCSPGINLQDTTRWDIRFRVMCARIPSGSFWQYA